MKRRSDDREPDWPAHLAEFDETDGWEHQLDWEIARVKWARAHGFTEYKLLPLIQSMVRRPGDAEDES